MDDNDEQLETYSFTVDIKAGSPEQAMKVITERLGHDEDYGFPYTIEFFSV